MANRPIVIDSTAGLPTGESGKWSQLLNMPVFVRDIVTPALKATTNVGDIVSGIPTAFARLDLFKAALDRTGKSSSASVSGLNRYYEALVKEWRGFIAALALDYPKFQVRRIDLAYHDGKDVRETENIYEPLGAFGNMLLERAPLWCAPSNSTARQVPFINIVKYDGKVVGGTSPETFLFTSVGYRVNPSMRPWIDPQTGKFIDPLLADMDEDQTRALYAYVGHVINNIGRVQNYYQELDASIRPSFNNLLNNLTDWHKEIAAYAQSHGYSLDGKSIPPVDAAFDEPFSFVFNFKDQLYGKDGSLTINPTEGYIAFDPKKALLPKDSEIARIVLDETYDRNPGLLAHLPVYVLKAPKKQSPEEYAYFALPLSAMGLNVFGRNIGAVAGVSPQGNSLRSTLTAVYDEEALENNLEVTLTLVTNEGQRRPFKESYTVRPDKAINKKDLILWPDFISRHWTRYFLYSEMPHNAQSVEHPYRAMPFVADDATDCSCILLDSNSEPIYLAQDGQMTNPTDSLGRPIVKSSLLVGADNRVADNSYKYEIYESDLPFKGVRLLSQTQKEGGFLVINYSSDRNTGLPYNGIGTEVNLRNASLGVDFGSTNTSVAYYDKDNSELKGLEFRNHRVSLLSSATDGDISNPKEKQIFFFQNGEIASNAIKSVLTLHDSRRLRVDDEGDNNRMMAREVKGGFPSFSNNLPVSGVEEKEIKLKLPGCGDVTQIHNMKWSDQEIDKSHKEAFLRSLMLHVYAQMFHEGVVPVTMKWSYPSSMGDNLLNSYRIIWDSLKDISPVVDENRNKIVLDVRPHRSGMIGAADGGVFAGKGDNSPFGSGAFGSGAFGSGLGSGAFGGAFGRAFGDASADSASERPVAAGSDESAGFGGPFGSGVFGSGTFGGSQPQEHAGFGSAPSGFAQPAQAAEPEIPDFMPDDNNKPVSFNPIPLPDDRSLTEACAVASYLVKAKEADTGDKLTLCFDIGGSTTDFSAICRLKQGTTMIKQNSIRFAAQRVAAATEFAPNFESVLKDICSRFGLSVMGLNKGPRVYKPDMAPYFFEQIVDRLKPEQLPDFYKQIAARCPELMSVNLYVTGLITFYAGQIAAKLIREVSKSPDCAWTGKPVVQVVFAGKGARIFEWFSTTSQYELANEYYVRMFMLGLGGEQAMYQMLADWPRINLSKQSSPDVKYEVSKGLAASNNRLFVPRDEVVIEIIGEDGFSIVRPDNTQLPLEADNGVTPLMMKHIGRYFKAPQPGFGKCACPRFMAFAELFYTAASKMGFNMPVEVFMEGFRNMNIDGYIKNLAEFEQAADKEREHKGKFDFVAPIIILEGMKFYDNYLIPNLSRR